MSSRRKNNKQKPNNSVSALQKSLSLLKTLNKDMALTMQRLKEDLSNTIAQNLSLKGELYETLVDRNCLWEKNMRLAELLRTLQSECLTFGKRIDDLFSPRSRPSSIFHVDSSGDFLADILNPEPQNGDSCPLLSDHVVHNVNFEPGILISRKSQNAFFNRIQDTNNLSPVTEEQCEDIVTSRLGRRSRLTQHITHMRSSECEEEFCPVKSSLERKLSGCIIIRNRDELDESPVDDYQPISENKTEIGAKPLETSDSAVENTKSIEEEKSTVSRSSLAGRSSIAGRRNASLLTINIMQQQSNLQQSPSVMVNVLPRKRRYASKHSLNDGFLDVGLNEETNKSENSKDSDILNSKITAVALEHLLGPNEKSPEAKPEISPSAINAKRRSTKKSWRPSLSKCPNSKDRRRSFRNRETVTYAEN